MDLIRKLSSDFYVSGPSHSRDAALIPDNSIPDSLFFEVIDDHDGQHAFPLLEFQQTMLNTADEIRTRARTLPESAPRRRTGRGRYGR
jgi:hypothetical protein